MPLEEVDAILAHSGAITGNGYHTEADSVVANLNFWPRPLAILMSAESFDALAPEQQDAPLTAGANVFGAAMEASRTEDPPRLQLLTLRSRSSSRARRSWRSSPLPWNRCTTTWQATPDSGVPRRDPCAQG